ncbi:glucosyltransferase [Pseudozyma hubeiensis SY62]|uniref:dolichyl-P-Glc:Man9GlcNAc2-PP-dolichol alpha-1,3-glucosyltransferase n=1 Tax=Pseudozyma hubeiensis (strain SY62) TaxID=1305764 RepID=R9NZ63_PSEHS|nr:glucosyltransferase [Pseudozyma hubeiensis SY62]GAC94044.1 glucosyltransferase [Pseudozyma hubeiensis SY62]
MSEAFSLWQERPEKLFPSRERKSKETVTQDDTSDAHPTTRWIQEQNRITSSSSRTDELDEYGIPIHPSQYHIKSAKRNSALPHSPSLASSSAFRPSPSSRGLLGPSSARENPSTDVRTSPSLSTNPLPLEPSVSLSHIKPQPDDADEDESIGLLLGQSKRRRGRKDSYSSFGSSVLPVPLFASNARYNTHAGSNSGLAQSRQAFPPKQGRSAYPPSNHSGAAPTSRHLAPPPIESSAQQLSQTDASHTRQRHQSNAVASRPSGFDLDSWLRTSQAPAPLRTSPSLGTLATFDSPEQPHRAGAFSEAGNRRRRRQAGSASGLSAGVLSAGPESPRSRRKASATSSRRDASGYSSLAPDHPALTATLELNREAGSRTIDTIEEWRAKSGSSSTLNAAGPSSTQVPDRADDGGEPSDLVPRRRRKSSVKSSSRPVSMDGPPPPLPSIPPTFTAASITSRTGRRRRKDTETSLADLLSPDRAHSAHRKPTSASPKAPALPPALRDLYALSGVGSQAETPVRRLIRWLAKEQLKASIVPLVLLASFLVRWIVARGDWSGRGVGPMHGDFEAQRHWIELTLHLPTSRWYFYDLQYWGLDYPPLTAWVSLACGYASRLFQSTQAGFAFETSRGNEDSATVTFMRATVVVGDLLVYLPAIALYLGRKFEGRGRRTQAIALLSILLQPALILVDHGHFQYNSIMLGFSAACFALLHTTLPHPDAVAASSSTTTVRARRQAVADLSRRLSYEYITAAVFFCLSLSFKQMALYYAPAVFAVMLGRCIGLARIDSERGLTLFIGLGLAVILTFGVVFAPWLTSLEQVGQVVHRIFPLARGLFEDKVANVWCFVSVLPLPARFKLKNVVAAKALARLSLVVTLVAILPGCCLLFWAASQTAKMEMMVAQEMVQTGTSGGGKLLESVAGSARDAKGGASHRSGGVRSRRSPSVVGSVAGAPARSEIESLLAGSVSKSLSGRISHAGPIHEHLAVSHDSDYPHNAAGADARPVASTLPSPAAQMLAYGLISVSSAFFLFGFQTHEKSILLPLLPMTLLLGAKGDTWGGQITAARDWQWSVWLNNMATFSLFPLLKRDGQALQYVVLTLTWNWLIGNLEVPFNPLVSIRLAASRKASFFRRLSIVTYAAAVGLHLVEVVAPRMLPGLQGRVWARYPDIYPVLNVLLTTPCFAVVYVWALVRQVQVAFANGWEVSLFATSSRKSQKGAKSL